jgi:hypothetical protein
MQFLVEVGELESAIFAESGAFEASSDEMKSNIDSLLEVFESNEMSTVGQQLAAFVSTALDGVVSVIGSSIEGDTNLSESLSGRQKAILESWKDYP